MVVHSSENWRVCLIDYGMGNILSVARGLEYCGAQVKITSDKKDFSWGTHLVLPGVGAFGEAVDSLHKLDLFEGIKNSIASGQSFLGICIGMQLLFEKSYEFGVHEGLGAISGHVDELKAGDDKEGKVKIPNIGWRQLEWCEESKGRTSFLKKNVKDKGYLFFAHSYGVTLLDQKNLVANACYGNLKFPALVKKNHVFGMQFHPEKSGEEGLQVLRNFLIGRQELGDEKRSISLEETFEKTRPASQI